MSKWTKEQAKKACKDFMIFSKAEPIQQDEEKLLDEVLEIIFNAINEDGIKSVSLKGSKSIKVERR